MTPAQVLANTRAQFNEANAAFITNEELYSYMWQAERQISKKIGGVRSTDSSITTVATTREYAIPSTIFSIVKVTWYAYPLKKIDLKQLDNVEEIARGFTGSTGDPDYYYEWEGKIGLSPIPTTAQTLKLWTIADPTEIDNTSTAFSIEAYLANYIIDFCLFRMYAKEDNTNKMIFHRDLWEVNLVKVANEWKNRNRSNRIQIVKEEEVYPITDMGMI